MLLWRNSRVCAFEARCVEKNCYIVTPVVLLQSEILGYSGSCWCWHPSSFYMVFCAAEVALRGGSAAIVLVCWYAPVCRRYLGKWPVLLKKTANDRL